MLWEGLSVARDLGRLPDIASILIRYGFGDAVRRFGVSTALEKAGKRCTGKTLNNTHAWNHRNEFVRR